MSDKYQPLRDAIAAGPTKGAWGVPHLNQRYLDAADPATIRALLEERDALQAVALLALYHHQGGLSPVGQPIRRALGIGQFDAMTDEQLAIAKRAALADGEASNAG